MTVYKRKSRKSKHSPKKSLGQNFLINGRACDRIIQSCNFHPDDIVLEIGPGKGALTEHIVSNVKRLTVVEKDVELADLLEQKYSDQNIEIVRGDILRYWIERDSNKVKVVGNIPYNISTPIIEHHIEQRDKIDAFFMTVQLEFGQRLAAVPGTKDYGSLSCYAQFYADVKVLFRIKNTSFYPIPKVHSCFLEMKFLSKPRFNVADEKGLFRFIQQTFTKRRKTIVNALHTDLEKDVIEQILESNEIGLKLRPENISLEQFVNLYVDVSKAEG